MMGKPSHTYPVLAGSGYGIEPVQPTLVDRGSRASDNSRREIAFKGNHNARRDRVSSMPHGLCDCATAALDGHRKCSTCGHPKILHPILAVRAPDTLRSQQWSMKCCGEI